MHEHSNDEDSYLCDVARLGPCSCARGQPCAFARLREEVALLVALYPEDEHDDAELVGDDEWRAFLAGHPELEDLKT